MYKAGEIAVELVKQGFATCQNRSMKYLEGSADKLRAAERQAKEKKLRKWQKYQHTGPEVLKYHFLNKMFIFIYYIL